MGRAEASFLQACADPAADLSRRITGLSPTELKKALEEDEGFWVYRLWE